MTYEKAYQELSAITEAIESENLPMDMLAKNVRRAAELIAFCQATLRATEAEVGQIIRQMEGGN